MAERGLKGLENWAKQITTGYNGVHVKDMSSSFRDGLAFCAIIHHYYPELIEFESLSKENILHNNSLAFNVAEKQLGVPALLDAEDMVKYAVPDRLSIITYLSQLHNCFENQNKVNRLKPVAKRIHKDQDGLPVKVPLNEQKNFAGRSYELCQICKHRVYILERLMVSGKLYHRTCFRCHKCNTLLQPGAYVESDTAGVYECAVCPHDEKEAKSSDVSTESNLKPSIVLQVAPKSAEDSPIPSPAASPKLYSSTFDTARNSFLQRSINSDDAYEHDTSANSSLSELSSMSLEAGAEETQLSSLEGNEDASKKHDDKSSMKSSGDSFYESSLERDLTSSRKPYQSVFSREISSLKPLNINRTDKTGLVLNSRPGLQSQISNGARTNTYDAPLIKPSTYLSPLSLPRPRSVGNFQQKLDKNNITHRRSSLDVSSTSEQPTNGDTNVEYRSELKNGTCENKRHSVSKIVSVFESNGHESPDVKVNSSSQFSVKDMVKMREGVQQANSLEKIQYPIPKIRLSKLRTKSEATEIVNTTEQSKIDHRSSDDLDSSEVEKDSQEESSLSLPESVDLQASVTETECKDNQVPLKENITSEKEPIDESNLNSEIASNVPEQNPFDSDNEDSDKQAICDNHESSSEVSQKSVVEDNVEKESGLLSEGKDNEIYPDDLNPFGDEDDEPIKGTKESYPVTLNPFGDDDEEEVIETKGKKVSDYDESKNPFADDDEECEIQSSTPSKPPVPATRTSILYSSPSRTSLKSLDTLQRSPTGSMTSTLKKRAAPKPPHVRDIFQNEAQNTSPNPPAQGSPSSLKLKTSSPSNRKTKRAPPPPSPVSTKASPVKVDEKDMKNIYNEQIQSESEALSKSLINGSTGTQNGTWKKKKRPAPPVPIPQRREIKKIPIKEIQSEMKEIGEKQIELENQGRDLEELIRDRDKDEEPTVEEEEYIMQLFELVNQKNALFRRQAELMYIKRSQRLEEQQVELEFQIRCLVNKPASQKTEEDEKQEQNLIQQLLDVVDQRNDIIETIERDRKREAEEDVIIQEQMEIKNSDLTITAEIKEKSHAQKKEKEKKKKEEKKREKKERKKKMKEAAKDSNDDGRGTLRKKWF